MKLHINKNYFILDGEGDLLLGNLELVVNDKEACGEVRNFHIQNKPKTREEKLRAILHFIKSLENE